MPDWAVVLLVAMFLVERAWTQYLWVRERRRLINAIAARPGDQVSAMERADRKPSPPQPAEFPEGFEEIVGL